MEEKSKGEEKGGEERKERQKTMKEKGHICLKKASHREKYLWDQAASRDTAGTAPWDITTGITGEYSSGKYEARGAFSDLRFVLMNVQRCRITGR